MDFGFEAKGHSIYKLTKHSAFAQLDCVEPVLGAEAAYPAPLIITERATHHGAAAILLQLAVTLWAFVVHDLPIDGLLNQSILIHTLFAVVYFLWNILLLAKIACLLVAERAGQFIRLLLLLIVSQFIQHLIAIIFRTE